MNLLTQSIIYLLFGVLFTYFAIQQVLQNGWGFFAYALVFLATIDIGSGLKMMISYLYIKKQKKSK